MRKFFLGRRGRVSTSVFALVIASCVGTYSGIAHVGASTPHSSATASLRAHVSSSGGAVTALDCNGDSPIQKILRPMNCTDIAGNLGADNSDTWGGKFYDNGQYIGHDEPDATFLSNAPGSGDNVNWNLTLGQDPRALPTTSNPGHDVSHWFELTPAPWLSMAMCDNFSFPITPCTPESDSNATTSTNAGGGSAFMEMQFYPPGDPPFVDSISCDDSHWCAALTIDSLECNASTCNPNCEEPVNFAFIQTDGVPDVNGYVPDNKTLLMNPGDQISVHMADAPASGGGSAFEVEVTDYTTHQRGFMQASAANGFVHTSITNCAQTPYNFQPEYNTASANNIIPWAALQTDISTEFETGHFEPCTSLTSSLGVNPFDSADPDGTLGECVGAYESGSSSTETNTEPSDAVCYHAGDIHRGFNGPGTFTAPDLVTGCEDNYTQNGDLDFDGTPYWPEWPTSTQPGLYPGSFVEQLPSSGGRNYSSYFFQTDIALSETSCTPTTLSGCTVPPAGPGGFYPFWSLTSGFGGCALEFGNVTRGFNVNDFGGDVQYGTNKFNSLGYPEFEGPLHSTNCGYGQGGGFNSDISQRSTS